MKHLRKRLLALLALTLFGGAGAWAQGPTNVTEITIELTKTGANQWTLGQTPDYDLELQVEYYDQYTLDSIPLGWQVKVGNAAPVHPTAYTEGNTTLGHLTITETDSVELIPPANVKPFVKNVTLVEPPVYLDNTTTAWADGSRLAVPAGGLTYSDAVTVSGNVTLTLTDGTTLTLNKGISLASGATLTIEGNGTMNVNGTDNNTSSTVAGTGTLVLTSGTLTAKGGNGAGVGEFGYGISANAGGNAINGNVTVSGGTLTATGGNGGNVGAGSESCSGGAGGAAIGGSLTINAGTMTTTNGAAGSVHYMSEGCSGGAAGKAVAGTVTDNRN